MDEPKRHVVDDYPASKLPDELRGGIDPAHRTRIIVEELPARIANGRTPAALRFVGAAADRKTSVEEAVARIRSLRDEWDS